MMTRPVLTGSYCVALESVITVLHWVSLGSLEIIARYAETVYFLVPRVPVVVENSVEYRGHCNDG